VAAANVRRLLASRCCANNHARQADNAERGVDQVLSFNKSLRVELGPGQATNKSFLGVLNYPTSNSKNATNTKLGHVFQTTFNLAP
jgi:hypothetical protein